MRFIKSVLIAIIVWAVTSFLLLLFYAFALPSGEITNFEGFTFIIVPIVCAVLSVKNKSEIAEKSSSKIKKLFADLGISWSGNYKEYYTDNSSDDCECGAEETLDSKLSKEDESPDVNLIENNILGTSTNEKSIPYVEPPTHFSKKSVDCEAIIRDEENWRRAQMGLNPIEYELQKIDMMEGRIFEYWCADILKDVGFCNVIVTQRSRDQGVDVLAEKDDVKYAIQCKCYSHPVGNDAVQAVHLGKSIYGCHVGIVMTNRSFTPAAEEAANATGVLLWDREKIIELIKMQV